MTLADARWLGAVFLPLLSTLAVLGRVARLFDDGGDVFAAFCLADELALAQLGVESIERFLHLRPGIEGAECDVAPLTARKVESIVHNDDPEASVVGGIYC